MNPNTSTDSREWFTETPLTYESAVVTNAPTRTNTDSDVEHTVTVTPDTFNGEVTAEIPVTAVGDITMPMEGQRVYIAHRRNTKPIVTHQRYEEDGDDIPLFEPGMRRVSHPSSDSHVTFNTDGSIRIENDGGVTVDVTDDAVTINDGETKAVTGVSTTTDGDGYVTDVSVSRTDSLYVP